MNDLAMKHKIVVGLGYGDEGKGTTVDWLCSNAREPIKAVIKFNGGPQAAHNVVLPDGRQHTFSQFGSGTFHGVPTHLSKHVAVNPLSLNNEADALRTMTEREPLDSLTISENCLLVTPYHRAANRARERARGTAAHGSCGVGYGETIDFARTHPDQVLRVRDLQDPPILKAKLAILMLSISCWDLPIIDEEWPSLRTVLALYDHITPKINIVPNESTSKLIRSGPCVFEGAQGIMLDQDFGFHPHTTWSNTTGANAIGLLDEAGVESDGYTRIGVTRTYSTRHGHGPFPGEDSTLLNPEPHNQAGEFQGAWRQAPLNLTMLNYAVRANRGVDEIMVTHCDILPSYVKRLHFEPMLPSFATMQKMLGQQITAYPTDTLPVNSITELRHHIRDCVGVNPRLLSTGPTFMDKDDCYLKLSSVS